MPGDSLNASDLPAPPDPGLQRAIDQALRAYELQSLAPSAHNAEIEGQQAIDDARLRVQLEAFEAAFVGPPLPRGHRTKLEREKVRRAEMRVLLRRLKDA